MRKSIPMFRTEKPGRLGPPRTHRNEFPPGYSLAGRSPASPASAFPAELILLLGCPLFKLSQKRAQSIRGVYTGRGYLVLTAPDSVGCQSGRGPDRHRINFTAK